MNTLEQINLGQTIFTGIGAIAAIMAAVLAYRIGKKQTEIVDFVEIFLLPKQIAIMNHDNTVKEIRWNAIIQNASSYPIYLTSFELNGIKHEIGNSVIPNNPDCWYGVPIPKDVQDKAEFSLLVKFYDYLGRKYQGESSGSFDGTVWNLKSKEKVLIS